MTYYTLLTLEYSNLNINKSLSSFEPWLTTFGETKTHSLDSTPSQVLSLFLIKYLLFYFLFQFQMINTSKESTLR